MKSMAKINLFNLAFQLIFLMHDPVFLLVHVEAVHVALALVQPLQRVLDQLPLVPQLQQVLLALLPVLLQRVGLVDEPVPVLLDGLRGFVFAWYQDR